MAKQHWYLSMNNYLLDYEQGRWSFIMKFVELCFQGPLPQTAVTRVCYLQHLKSTSFAPTCFRNQLQVFAGDGYAVFPSRVLARELLYSSTVINCLCGWGCMHTETELDEDKYLAYVSEGEMWISTLKIRVEANGFRNSLASNRVKDYRPLHLLKRMGLVLISQPI